VRVPVIHARHVLDYCPAHVPRNKLPGRVEGTCGCIARWSVDDVSYCKRHAMIVLWRVVVEGKKL